MIYIQSKNGLTQVSPSLTKEKIIAALGYTPADNATFWEDESGALVIADEKGYVIARIDANGVTTTQVSAAAIKLNDVDLATKLAELEAATPEVDLSDYYTKSEVDDAIANASTGDIDLSKYALAADVAADKVITDAHMDDKVIHLTDSDRDKWNAKSDFSGNYTDLANAPNIQADENENELIICDASGNIIMRVDANGLNTTNLYLNGQPLGKSNTLSGKRLSILGDSISTFSNYIPSGYTSYYPAGDVTDASQTWWMQLINNNNMLLGTNCSYSSSPVQSGEDRTGFVEDERVNSLANNGTPDIIIIEGGINDGKVEDLATLGEINPVIDLPLTSTSADVYDTSTFLGAYQALITKLMVKYPNAQIACWNVPWTSRPDVMTSDDLYKASEKIEELCTLYGCIFLDIRKCGINPGNMSTYLGAGDTTITHPKAAGMELIAKYIEKCLA